VVEGFKPVRAHIPNFTGIHLIRVIQAGITASIVRGES